MARRQILKLKTMSSKKARRKDYYKVLDIPRDASQSDIKRAYRKLALKYHPDKNKSSNATKKFQDIGEAYSVLSDPAKRRRHDLELSGQSGGNEFSNSTTFTESTTENFTMDDAINVFLDFMYGGEMPSFFWEENMRYHTVEVTLSVAQHGGCVDMGAVGNSVQIDGIFSGKWTPFIVVGESDTVILKVLFPPDMGLEERRILQKVFLGFQALSLAARTGQYVLERYPEIGAIVLCISVVAALFWVMKKFKQ